MANLLALRWYVVFLGIFSC